MGENKITSARHWRMKNKVVCDQRLPAQEPTTLVLPTYAQAEGPSPPVPVTTVDHRPWLRVSSEVSPISLSTSFLHGDAAPDRSMPPDIDPLDIL